MSELSGVDKTLFDVFDEMLDEKMSNAGCNDFELIKYIPDLEERRAFMREAARLNYLPGYDYEKDPEYIEELERIAKSDCKYCMDFQVWSVIRHRILK
jgi:hypothetical protein